MNSFRPVTSSSAYFAMNPGSLLRLAGTAIPCLLLGFPLAVFLTGQSVYAQDAGFGAPNAIPVSETRIEIKDQVEVSVEVPGTITVLEPSLVGGIVEKGQLIVQLDDDLIRAQLEEAKAKAESKILIDFAIIKRDQSQLELDDKQQRNKRTPGLFNDAEIRRLELTLEQSKAELEKSKHDKVLAELAATTKEKELKQFTRHAELSGHVTDLHKRAVGSSVRPGDPIMTIVNLTEVLAVLTISPDHERLINIGDKVLLRKAQAAGGSDSGNSFLKTAAPSRAGQKQESSDPAAPEIFEGTVTLITPTIKTDRELSLQVYAVVKNKSVGRGKFLLREGSAVESVIIPQPQ